MIVLIIRGTHHDTVFLEPQCYVKGSKGDRNRYWKMLLHGSWFMVHRLASLLGHIIFT